MGEGGGLRGNGGGWQRCHFDFRLLCHLGFKSSTRKVIFLLRRPRLRILGIIVPFIIPTPLSTADLKQFNPSVAYRK